MGLKGVMMKDVVVGGMMSMNESWIAMTATAMPNS
jgi:hypothetical protein